MSEDMDMFVCGCLTFDLSYDFAKSKNPTKEQKIAFDTVYKNYNRRKKLCKKGYKYPC
jgi:hypothetical protein